MWCDLRNPDIRFSFYGTAGFLSCSSVDPPKPTLKTTQNSPLHYFEVNIPGNFQKWKFSFFLIFSKSCSEKNFYFITHWASWDVSLSILENRTQIYPKPLLYSLLKLTFPEIFKNESILNILKIFLSDLRLGSSDRLTNYWDILKSVGKVVRKF